MLLVFAALGYAATAPTSRPVRWYLAAQLAYLIVVWPAAYWLGLDDWIYTLVYAVMTLACLATAVLIAIFALPHHANPAVVILIPPAVSIIVLVLASFGIHHATAGVYTQLGESTVLVTAGTLLGFCAPFYENRSGRISALTLSALWLLQAAFRYCYVLHPHTPGWETANVVVPAMLMIAACALLGIRMRSLNPHERTDLVYQ